MHDRPDYDWIVVGAGFAGAVMAERIAAVRGETVLVVDKRDHIAGNAHDRRNADGIMFHQYGPHIFHTNSTAIADYLSRFTDWRPYEHRVLASVDGQLVPIPINRTTINMLYGLDLDEPGVASFLAARAEDVAEIRTSEDVVVSKIGRELYEKFFRGYTSKQWGLDPSELDRSVTARVPTRTNDDDRYFTDSFQNMPRDGYTAMFERMLANPLITVKLGVDGLAIPAAERPARMVYTGPIDEYFGQQFGALPYRSLQFCHVSRDVEFAQAAATINFPQDQEYTRITEVKHLTGQTHPRTMLTYEYPSATGDPYYPIPRPENEALFKQYDVLARAEADTWFVGRLATYRYYNMDQVVGQALASFLKLDAAVPRAAAQAA